MKRLLSLILAFTTMLCLCACQGNWESVSLKDPIEIPENGVITKSIVQQIKDENAIGVFEGASGDLRYSFTVFGSSITDPKDVDLGVQLRESADGEILVTLNRQESFGFSAMLSITLNKLWSAQSATAYVGSDPIGFVSLTGSKTTILNLTLDGTVGHLQIRPDPLLEQEAPSDNTEPPVTQPPITENGGKDQYNTDPIPEGKPKPVEPEDQEVEKGKTYTCTFSIECSTILNNLGMLDPEKLEMVPSSGVILAGTAVTFYEGESVFDVLQRVCKEKGIHLEASWTPMYNSAYIEGIHNLYEFDCGALSGWMYKVNGWYPNYGCSRYQLQDGDVVEWRFTCDLGNDIGGGQVAGD